MNAAIASDVKVQQILQAVRNILVKNGYAGTTISLVAAEAGVSRGLLHYYFKNKDEMLAKVLEENMLASVALAAGLFEKSHSAAEIAHGFIQALRTVLKADPDFFHLFFEGWAVARQSTLVDGRLKALYGQFRMAVRDGLAHALEDGRIATTLSVDGLAVLITGIIDGLGLQLVTEPSLADDERIWAAAADGIVRLLES
ncbi:MAG: TetR/AcrR family transcriptional regulator [Desulfobacteraceae bacterium]|nr:TetR/AcrR family transcriptional regulator [Desulfobacteraceae bacterium]